MAVVERIVLTDNVMYHGKHTKSMLLEGDGQKAFIPQVGECTPRSSCGCI
jgi:hypothetical protein